jgi:hypothetical protein
MIGLLTKGHTFMTGLAPVRRHILVCLAAILAGASVSTAQRADPSATLATVTDYLAKYEREVVVIVAQEDYTQRIASALRPTRHLRSDLVMIPNAERGWLEFRDVFEVDGRAVRDHDDRLVRLFLKPNPNAQRQAAAIVEESARFNLAPSGLEFERTLNIPLEALRFLRAVNQSRSRFEIVGEERTPSGSLIVLGFHEQTKPRVISSPTEEAASGKFWIEPGSGAVVRSELQMSAPNLFAAIKVTYARQLDPPIWLPVSMDEDYTVIDRTISITGRATYSNFRRFRVDVSSDLRSETDTRD